MVGNFKANIYCKQLPTDDVAFVACMWISEIVLYLSKSWQNISVLELNMVFILNESVCFPKISAVGPFYGQYNALTRI